MLFLSLFRHLKWHSGRDREGRSRRRRTPRPRASCPLRPVLWLEVLEDRTVPSLLTVTSAADDGSAGSLRAVLAAAHSGDTIHFATQLKGHTIILTQGQVLVNQSLTIGGLGASSLAISGNAASRIFH